MAHSLANQIKYAINSNWSEGTQKRNYRMENGPQMSPKIFSYSESFRLKDVGSDFSRFVNHEFPHIKQIKDITPEIIQKFLDSKANCSKQTLETYYYSLKKIDMVLCSTYKTYQKKFIDIVKPMSAKTSANTGRGVHNQIPVADFERILSYCREHPSQSAYIIQLQKSLGIRVNELTHGLSISNINFAKNEVVIHNTKGGKTLVKSISPETATLLREIIRHRYSSNNNLFSIHNNSVNRYLSRICEKLNISQHYSIHNIRSRVAQDYYDNLRSQGFSKQHSLHETSLFLNHRTTREQMLTTSYIFIA